MAEEGVAARYTVQPISGAVADPDTIELRQDFNVERAVSIRQPPSEADRYSDAVTHRRTIALAWIHARAARDMALGADLFFDPGWNMLLDLHVHSVSGKTVSVSSICIASKVPMTTALRWLTMLQDRCLVERRPDKLDGRRHNVYLTEIGLRRMEIALDGACESDRKLGIGRIEALN